MAATPPSPKLDNPISISADVVNEILLRLPAKSLIRFKSVCKTWLSLFSSDYFCHQHTLRRPKSQPSLILQHSGQAPDVDCFYWNPTSINGENVMIPYELTTVFPHHHYLIHQSCNGLMLLIGDNGGDFYFGRRVYRVYNPTTRLSSEINPSYNDEDHDLAAIALAFDPSKSPYYKIVCIIRCLSSKPDDDTYTYRVEVYDSESRSWKLSFEPFTLPSKFCYRQAKYWNNAIYWWRPNMGAYYCFDIAKNEMKRLSFPPYHGKRDSYLQELDGNLYYLILNFRGSGSREVLLKVWELRGDDEWLLKHNHVFDCEGIGKCLRLMGGANENLVVVIHHRRGKMKAYSFLHKSCAPFDYSYGHKVFAYHLKAFEFGETLALV